MAIEKVPGVESVQVSLNEGIADVALREGNGATVDGVREIVRKNGFTPKESTVTVRGKLIERGGKPALAAGPHAVFLLQGNVSTVFEKSHKQVRISGVVPETASPNDSLTLEVKTVSSEDG